jgi:hypothetical protein
MKHANLYTCKCRAKISTNDTSTTGAEVTLQFEPGGAATATRPLSDIRSYAKPIKLKQTDATKPDIATIK